MTRRSRANGILLVVLVLASLAIVWPAVRPPVVPLTHPLVIDDVTQLNPIGVSEVVRPTAIEEIVHVVRRHNGPISIGGARHSMGGHIAADGGLHIDMRRFNAILEFSPVDRTITVQAGATWRQILEHIDPADLSVAIMQSVFTGERSLMWRVDRTPW